MTRAGQYGLRASDKRPRILGLSGAVKAGHASTGHTQTRSSLYLYVRKELLCSHWKDFRDVLYSGLPLKSSEKIPIWLKQGKNIGILCNSNGPFVSRLYNADSGLCKVRTKAGDTKATETDCVLCKARFKAEENSSAEHSSQI